MNHDKSHANGGGQVAVAFAQNTRDEVRFQGNGDIAGALAAEPGMKQTTYLALQTRGSNLDVGGISGTIGSNADRASGSAPMVAEPYTLAIRGRSDSHDLEYRQDGTANALLTPNGGRGGIGVGAVATGWAVRRLLPVECEKLMGFEPGWTAIPGASDGTRYRQLGNSMAVPVVQWIGRRISEASAP
jgi:DNA (cytosine-5)-methyltransferase 1